MEIVKNNEIVNASVMVKCTFVRAFTDPVIESRLCIRSYDNKLVTKFYRELVNKTGIAAGQIATTTGNTTTDANGVLWLEVNLLYCNRRPMGWVRANDVNVYPLEVAPPVGPGETSTDKKNNSWLAWLAGGATLLRILVG